MAPWWFRAAELFGSETSPQLSIVHAVRLRVQFGQLNSEGGSAISHSAGSPSTIAKWSAAAAVLVFIGFMVLSYAPATTPDGTVCGNFWHAVDIGGCNSGAVRRRGMIVLWIALTLAFLAVVAGIAALANHRRRRDPGTEVR